VRQDEDVLDTWFSSQLWPFATLGWPEETPELDYFYPTSVLSTARDILFLWVARMVMSGLSFRGDIPFKDVIIHPTVFNAEGKRMSKSLGTGVDPLDLMAHYGADGMRFGLMLQVTGNQDIRFSEEKLVSSRNFANKIYNASRFVMMNLDGYEPGAPIVETAADAWILSRLAGLAAAVDEGLDAYEFGEVSRRLYDFFWSEFADWYIELAKGRLIAGAAEDASEAAKAERLAAQRNLVFVLDTSLRLLHPMMPFVTEAIWENLPLGDDRAPMLLVAPWPDAAALAAYADPAAETAMALRQDVATKVRALVAERQLPRKTRFALVLPDEVFAEIGAASWAGETVALAGVDEILPASAAGDRSVVGKIIVEGTTVEVAAELEGAAGYDPAAELARLAKKLEAARVDLARLEKKLGNEGFLAKAAPEVIAKDRGRRDELVREVDALQTRVTELEQLA
jgi:valyl-tRNA synthetase